MVAIAALSSCSKNDPILSEPGKQALIFTATMEGNATRATYNSTEKCASWEVNDQISINGKTYNAQSAGLTTTFRAATEGQEAEGETYNAYFACTYDGSSATLPAQVSETWADGKFNMPMYATSTTTNLQFKNLCGVLKITVKSDQIAAVKKIRVSSANAAISGSFTVDANNAAVLSDASTVANTLTITYTEAVPTTAEGKVFYVAVPAQTYQELKIELDADGNGFTKSMTTKSATDITVARNKIYPITFANNAATKGTAKATIGGSEVDVNWVQLWEGGPKFAEYNVGVITERDRKAESYGGYYGWGGSKEKAGDYNTGSAVLTGDNDTATKLWGNNWRMPTRAEFSALIDFDHCRVEWTTVNGVNGLGITGYGDYRSNSIFLPAAGHHGGVDQGNYGYYWSSTPDGSNFAYFMDFCLGYYLEHHDVRYFGYSVRAVLK